MSSSIEIPIFFIIFIFDTNGFFQFECIEKSNGEPMAVKTITKHLQNGSSPKSLPIWKNSCDDDETCVSPNIDWLRLFLV